MKARAWKKLDSVDQYRGDIFSIRKERSRSPQSEREHEFDILDSPDWVNVIALTAEGKVVLIRQFRHGTGEITTEIPGGMIDPGENPLEAARRELREETGYQATEWEGIGTVEPNPAFQTNTTYSFLARGAHLAGEQRPDENEEIEVFEHPLGNIWQLLEGGIIKHALVLCAFFHLVRHGDLALPGR
jgi:ADP-ribose pyrophosphatase